MIFKLKTKEAPNNKMNYKQTTKAFTLLEMLLVIAIIAILAGIVIVAINPGRQLAQARNAQRASDLRALHSAVQQYYIDNRAWPTGIDGTVQDVCKFGVTDPNCINLDVLVPDYVSDIPEDPNASSPTSTDYQIVLNTNTQSIGLTAVRSSEYSLEYVSIGLNPEDAAWTAFIAETNDIIQTIEEYVADKGGDYMSLVNSTIWSSYYSGYTAVTTDLGLVMYGLYRDGYGTYNDNYGANILGSQNFSGTATNGMDFYFDSPNSLSIGINEGWAGCSLNGYPYVIVIYNQNSSFGDINREPFVQSTQFGFSGSWCLYP